MIEKLKADKFYVVDSFSGPIAGPFDSKAAASKEARSLNIAGDCLIGFAYQAVGENGAPCMKLKQA